MSDEQTAAIEAGDYRLSLRSDDDWPFWLENKDGEGMSCSELDIAEMFGKHFKEYF